MKKKILLMFAIVVALVCALSISVSASNYDVAREVTLDSGDVVALYDQEGYALTWYMNGNTLTSKRTVDLVKVNGSGWLSYRTDVEGFGGSAYVVVANFQDTHYSDLFENEIVGIDVTYRNSTNAEYVFLADEFTKFNQWYTFSKANKLKVVELTPNSKLTSFLQYMFHENTAIKSFFIPSGVTAIPDGEGLSYGFMFGCTSLETVTFGENSQLKVVGLSAFMKCTNLKNITLPDSVTTLKNNALRESGIVNCPFTENSRCTDLGNNSFYKCASLDNFTMPKDVTKTQNETANDGGLFDRCTALTTVIIPEGSKLTFIGNRTFNGCSSLVNVQFNEGLLKIGSNAFNGTGLVNVKLPNSLTELDGRAFQSCKSLVEVRLGASFTKSLNVSVFYLSTGKYFYIPKTAVSFNEHCFGTAQNGMGSNDMVFFYCGTKEEFAKITFDANNQRVSGATIINWGEDAEGNKVENPTDDYYKTLATNNKKCYIVCGYNTCDAFYDSKHMENVEYSYKSYDAEGTKTTTCTRNGCTHNKEEKIAPLFEIIGYSSPEDADREGMVIGYTINHNALSVYEKATGKTLSYGVYAVAQQKLGANDIFGEGGKVADGAITVEIKERTYSSFEFKLTGFNDDNKDKALALGAYVAVNDGEKTEYSYMQMGTPAEDAKYVFMSYTEYLALIKA